MKRTKKKYSINSRISWGMIFFLGVLELFPFKKYIYNYILQRLSEKYVATISSSKNVEFSKLPNVPRRKFFSGC